MANTYLHPTAGYIANFGIKQKRGLLSSDERNLLRELAKKVLEISKLPIQETRIMAWTGHNDLNKVKPLVICYPEDGWCDLIPVESLVVKDSFWQSYEWYLKHLIYRHENINDDFVIVPEIISFIKHKFHNSDWGLEKDNLSVSKETTTYNWGKRPLSSYDNLKNLRLPVIEISKEVTDDDYAALHDVFGDILMVNKFLSATAYGGGTYTCNQPGIAAHLRGVEQILWDVYDYKDELHELLRLITKGNIAYLLDIEEKGLIRSNTQNYYTDAGGNGYTNQLPKNKNNAKLKDCWGYGVAQEYSEISPEMHNEFGVKYQKQVLELFGLNAYGCCEPYTNKFEILKAISNLRRISISPFCDFEKAASALKDNFIYSFKPNPSILISDLPIEMVRKYISDVLIISKDCRVEIFLKDIIHLKHQTMQNRFLEVANTIKEEIDKIY